jgi:glycosyltransferase involved in cell wall biosynthesis
MQVLHISETDGPGGAAKSARSLHHGLLEHDVGSRMLVGRKLTESADTRPIKRNNRWRAVDRPFGRASERLSLQYAFYPSSFGVAGDRWFREADILQLHNLHGSFFGFTALPFLSRRRETVWWIQDMWPVTGHVAYSYDCERWRLGCGSCPYLGEYPSLRNDRTALLWRLKRATYRHSRLTIVTSSRWLDTIVGESPLLGHFERHRIPNGVDLDFFRPLPKDEARRRLGVDPELPVVLVFDGEIRKGAGLIPEVVARLGAAAVEATVIVAGQRGSWPAPPSLRVHDLGRIEDEAILADAYAAADVFLLPTLADNLPNSVLESLASGTAVVATRVGGISDAVEHLRNGYLADPGSAHDLAAGLIRMLTDEAMLRTAQIAARETAEREFGERSQSQRFLDLYESLRSRRAA